MPPMVVPGPAPCLGSPAPPKRRRAPTDTHRTVRIVRNPNPFPSRGQDRPADQRRRGRLRTDTLTCELGHILDLSATGLRLRCRTRHAPTAGQTLTLTLRAPVMTLPVQGVIRWVQRVNWLSTLVGVEFIGLTPEQTARLRELSRITMDDRTMTDEP